MFACNIQKQRTNPLDEDLGKVQPVAGRRWCIDRDTVSHERCWFEEIVHATRLDLSDQRGTEDAGDRETG